MDIGNVTQRADSQGLQAGIDQELQALVIGWPRNLIHHYGIGRHPQMLSNAMLGQFIDSLPARAARADHLTGVQQPLHGDLGI